MSNREKFWELAQALVQVPTVTGKEYLITDLLQEKLVEADVTIHEQKVPGAGGSNIIGSRGQGGPWFVTHVDVYPPYEHPDPFSLSRSQDGKLAARGIVDTKGQIASLLWSLMQTSEPVQVAFVVDEEKLGRGSKILEVPSGCLGAIVLEPTDLRIAYAEAGSIGLEVMVTGEAVHGALPWLGQSAIEFGFSMYQRLMQQPFLQHNHPLFSRGGWVNLGRISGGYDTMVVPNRCQMDLEVGFAPGISAGEVLEQVQEAFSEAHYLHISDMWDPWEADPETIISHALSSAIYRILGRPAKKWGMPSWTDGAHLVQKGVPTLIFGAGDLAVAHSWNEDIYMQELETLADILTTFIRG